MVRGTVNLPHGTGKTARVAVFAVGDKAEEAAAAGADEVGSDDLIEKIQGGFLDFDAAIATPDQMAKVGRIARILGPRGLMPNPKTGTVTADITKAVNDIKGGKINFRVDKQANLHFVIGKASFDEKALAENYGAALDEILRAKPSSSKGRYLKKIVVSTTTGPGHSGRPVGHPQLRRGLISSNVRTLGSGSLVHRWPSPAHPSPVREPATAAEAGFVDIRSVIPDAVVDLRYATADNFVGKPLYPPDARCLVDESLAPGLAKAADAFRARGAKLVFWDCYRPHAVQVELFDAVPDPNWVARPGTSARSHESGRSVDVTLADAHYGWLIDMGTGFDDFSPRAKAFATDGVSEQQQANRAWLRDGMSAGGLSVYSGEWWHFDGPGADVGQPILDVPLS